MSVPQMPQARDAEEYFAFANFRDRDGFDADAPFAAIHARAHRLRTWPKA